MYSACIDAFVLVYVALFLIFGRFLKFNYRKSEIVLKHLSDNDVKALQEEVNY